MTKRKTETVNDLSRCLDPLDMDATLIAVIEMSQLRWSRNFAQGVKWNLGLTAGMLCLRIRSEDEEASPPEPHAGL